MLLLCKSLQSLVKTVFKTSSFYLFSLLVILTSARRYNSGEETDLRAFVVCSLIIYLSEINWRSWYDQTKKRYQSCAWRVNSVQSLWQLGAEQRNVVCHWVRQRGSNLAARMEAQKGGGDLKTRWKHSVFYQPPDLQRQTWTCPVQYPQPNLNRVWQARLGGFCN